MTACCFTQRRLGLEGGERRRAGRGLGDGLDVGSESVGSTRVNKGNVCGPCGVWFRRSGAGLGGKTQEIPPRKWDWEPSWYSELPRWP